MNPKKLLIFDLDGTLLDSVPDLADALIDALRKHNLPTPSADQVRHWVGNGAWTLCQRAVPKNTSQALLTKVYEDFLQFYEKNCCHKSVLYEGVKQGLDALQTHGFVLTLCTNKPKRFLPAILSKFKMGFEQVVAGDSLSQKKPHPLPLLHICQTQGIAPELALMIGDSKNDIQAAKNANIASAALGYGYNHSEPIAWAEPDVIFDNFWDLTAWLCTKSSSTKPKPSSP